MMAMRVGVGINGDRPRLEGTPKTWSVPFLFKSGELYQVKITIKPGVGLREGDVGDMWDAKNGIRLPGGGHQVDFIDKTPRTNPELYEVHFDSVRSLK